MGCNYSILAGKKYYLHNEDILSPVKITEKQRKSLPMTGQEKRETVPLKKLSSRKLVVNASNSSHLSFQETYKLKEVLGEGSYSVVRRCVQLKTNIDFAVKIINKSKLKHADQALIQNEIQVFFKLRHPNIVKFEEFYEDDMFYYIVMEYVKGGQLFDRIVEHIDAQGAYTETEARSIIHTLIHTIGYLHELGIAHRDIKPENILLTSNGEDAVLKIADFGFSKHTTKGNEENCFRTMRGTPGYVAPEILMGDGYGKKVDMWALGVISFILLCGSPPFYDTNKGNLFMQIIKSEYSFDTIYWDTVSEDAKDFVTKLLNSDPQARYDYKKCLKHRWIMQSSSEYSSHSSAYSDTSSLSVNDNLKGAVERLKKYNNERKTSHKRNFSDGAAKEKKDIKKHKRSLTESIFNTHSFFQNKSNEFPVDEVVQKTIKSNKQHSKTQYLSSTLLDSRPAIGAFTDLCKSKEGEEFLASISSA